MVSAANSLTRELKIALVLGLYDTANILSSGKVRNWQQTRSQGGCSWRAERLSGESFTMETSTIKKVANPAPVVDWSKKKLIWPNLADFPVGELGGSFDPLISTDYAHLLVVQEFRGGKAGQPIASRTRLGWIILGVTDTQDTWSSVRSYRIIDSILLVDLKNELHRLCDTEDFGTGFQSGCLTPDTPQTCT